MATTRTALPDDVDVSALIHTIYSYRFLTFQQLCKLHSGLTESTLKLLVGTRHLAAIKRPSLSTRTPKIVYALDRRGADLITEELDVDRAALRWRAHRNLIGLLFLEHRLVGNDVRIAMKVGAPRHHCELVHWYYEPVIQEDIVDPVERVVPLRLRPDAYLRLRFTTGRLIHAFLEVDMSSEGYATIAAKVKRYIAYKTRFRYRLLARSFRVLFVVPSLRRLQSLKRVIEEADGRGMFWLASARDVNETTLSDAVWRVAGSDEFGSLGGRQPPPGVLSDASSNP